MLRLRKRLSEAQRVERTDVLPRGFMCKTRATPFGSCDLGASSDVDTSVQGSYRGEEREMTSADTWSHPSARLRRWEKAGIK